MMKLLISLFLLFFTHWIVCNFLYQPIQDGRVEDVLRLICEDVAPDQSDIDHSDGLLGLVSRRLTGHEHEQLQEFLDDFEPGDNGELPVSLALVRQRDSWLNDLLINIMVHYPLLTKNAPQNLLNLPFGPNNSFVVSAENVGFMLALHSLLNVPER